MKTYWFDQMFQADSPFPIPSRDTTLEEMFAMLEKAEEKKSHPQSISDILRERNIEDTIESEQTESMHDDQIENEVNDALYERQSDLEDLAADDFRDK